MRYVVTVVLLFWLMSALPDAFKVKNDSKNPVMVHMIRFDERTNCAESLPKNTGSSNIVLEPGKEHAEGAVWVCWAWSPGKEEFTETAVKAWCEGEPGKLHSISEPRHTKCKAAD